MIDFTKITVNQLNTVYHDFLEILIMKVLCNFSVFTSGYKLYDIYIFHHVSHVFQGQTCLANPSGSLCEFGCELEAMRN